jgi:hypothetical protein
VCNVFSGNTTSCGRCNEISADEMAVRKFGHLTQKFPKDTLPGSGKMDEWTCDCGRTTFAVTHSVFSHKTTTCGCCSLIIKQWYQNNKDEVRKAKTPIEPGYFPDCPIIFLDTITNTCKPVPALCPACKNEYYPRWSDIRHGRSLTCGCVSSRISRPAMEISDFIRSLGFETKFEYKVNGLAYDVLAVGPSKNLLIEYDGPRFHDGSEESLKREAKKEKNALDSGYEFLRIKEVEWKKNNRDDTKKRIAIQLDVDFT